QTQDLRMQQVTTQDGVDLPAVNAILNYRVLNPLKAMTAVDDYRETTFAIAMARVRNTVSNHTLKDFLDTEDIQEKNLAINGEGKYQFKELEDIGTKNGRPIYYKS
ncbi:hypothetical protein COU56_04555, partial [Candidatus Pacearchaeota archaeon CG10_big_fil_rev_8_21_14_0_10_31_9]